MVFNKTFLQDVSSFVKEKMAESSSKKEKKNYINIERDNEENEAENDNILFEDKEVGTENKNSSDKNFN